jgi:PAB1-binding protein PBP1
MGLGVAQAQDLFVYPANGQSQDQQQKDEYDCYSWAKQNTGYDPAQPQSASVPPPAAEEPVGGAGRGAVRGGLTGLAVGAIAGDAGKGAAIGAVSGGLIGGIRRHDQSNQQQQQQAQYQQQASAELSQRRNDYNRAYAACLEGRGYTVK